MHRLTPTLPAMLIVTLMAWFQTTAYAAPVELSSTVHQTVLLELYTSEGCSSCPPADRWLSQFRDHHGLWQRIVPVAFHVDYWDRLGWRDRFAKPGFSKRQYMYKHHNRIDVVYTPGMVINGKEWRGWFNKQPLPPATTDKVGILKAQIEGNNGSATFTSVTPRVNPLVLNVAVLGFGLSSAVSAGENNGRTLIHDFVVLQFQQNTQTPEDHAYHWPLDNIAAVSGQGKRGIALWVTEANDPTPIQATGGWINESDG